MSGSMSVVSIGPGDHGLLVPLASQLLESAQVIAGYTTYLKLIEGYLEGKTVISTGMRSEVDRCQQALVQFRMGKKVVLVCGGDAGVYGLAGLVLELMEAHERTHLTVIPGVTSATASAALLGAPLVHDFAVISLSDLLTDSELIEKRLLMAADGDFVTVIYNPASHSRRHLFQRTAEIFLEYRSPATPVGIVKDAWRDAQQVSIISLDQLTAQEYVDMRTTLIIGNSQTRQSDGRMYTPRGYKFK